MFYRTKLLAFRLNRSTDKEEHVGFQVSYPNKSL